MLIFNKNSHIKVNFLDYVYKLYFYKELYLHNTMSIFFCFSHLFECFCIVKTVIE